MKASQSTAAQNGRACDRQSVPDLGRRAECVSDGEAYSTRREEAAC